MQDPKQRDDATPAVAAESSCPKSLEDVIDPNICHTVMESLPDGILVIDRERRILAANKATEILFGYSRDELISQLVDILVPDAHRDRHAEQCSAFFARPKQVTMAGRDLPAVRKDGSEITVSIRLGPIYASDQLLACAVIRDVSQSRRVARALQNAESQVQSLLDSTNEANRRLHEEVEERRAAEIRLRQILDSMFAFVGVFTLAGEVAEMNRAPLEIAGLERDDVIGKPLWETYWCSYSPEIQERFRQALASAAAGETVRGDIPIRIAGGEMITIDVTFGPLFDSDGNIVQLIGSAVDITERTNAEQLLNRSEEQVRLLLDSTGEAIYGLDMQGNCTFCNQACLTTLGFERADQLLGQQMHELIHHTREDGSNYPVHECKIYEAFRLGRGTHVDDEVMWKANGSSFDAEYRSFPIKRDGQLIGSVVTFVDITERKRVENELRWKQSELTHVARLSMLGEMAAGLAHELNQPLTAVSALAEGAQLRLDRGKLPQSEFSSVCKRIAADAQRAGDIIRRLRKFVQKRKTEHCEVRTNELLREVATFVAADLRQENIVLNCRLQNDLWNVEADPVEIQQVVVNLVRNAADALSKSDCPRREIVIETHNRDCWRVEVIVTDSGPGISVEVVDHVFEPFYTSKTDGLGIGLGICKSIIETHGGRIWVGESAMGGASFHFDLPAQQQQGDMYAI
jgi:PAS domain S-box-containing protein